MIYIYIIISLSVILLAGIYYFIYTRRSFNLNRRAQVDSSKNKNKKDKSILKKSDVKNSNGNSASIGLNDNSDDIINDILDMDSNKKKVSFNKHVFIKYI